MDMNTQLAALKNEIERIKGQLPESTSRPADDVTSAAKATARAYELIGQSVYLAMQRGQIPASHVYELLDNFLWNDHERLLFGLQIMGDSPLRESRKPVVPVWGQNQFGRSN